jgi:hypothetical protein
MGNNYTLGRGKVSFAQYKPGTQSPRGERYLGNTPDLGFSAKQTNLDHYSSEEGVKTKDESVLLQVDYAGTLSTDNVSYENLAAFFLGSSATVTVASSTVTGEAITGVDKGASYQLGTSAVNPAGVRLVSAVIVKPTPTGTAFVVDVDYTVDLTMGRITILEGGAITANANIAVDYTVTAQTYNQSISQSTTIEGALRFIAANPAGELIDYFMPWVKLTPNGEFKLKGDAWQTLTFTLEILKKGTLQAVYANGRPYTP